MYAQTLIWHEKVLQMHCRRILDDPSVVWTEDAGDMSR